MSEQHAGESAYNNEVITEEKGKLYRCGDGYTNKRGGGGGGGVVGKEGWEWEGHIFTSVRKHKSTKIGFVIFGQKHEQTHTR